MLEVVLSRDDGMATVGIRRFARDDTLQRSGAIFRT